MVGVVRVQPGQGRVQDGGECRFPARRRAVQLHHEYVAAAGLPGVWMDRACGVVLHVGPDCGGRGADRRVQFLRDQVLAGHRQVVWLWSQRYTR